MRIRQITVPIGSIRIEHNGYRVIKIGRITWYAEHRYLVEKYIGYHLNKNWIIHHIDGNKLNNELKNLYIFKKKGEHQAFELLVREEHIDRYILKSNLDSFKGEIKWLLEN